MEFLNPTHIILILVAALIIFGPKRLPDIGKSLGKGIKEFKGALTHPEEDEPPAPIAAPVPAPLLAPAIPTVPAQRVDALPVPPVVATPGTPVAPGVAAPVAPAASAGGDTPTLIDTTLPGIPTQLGTPTQP
ncbi:MAG: hypothetical protein NVSMB32_15810 [Actinomycetota bacterium]